MAQEICEKDGIKIKMVIVKDDVALLDRIDPKRSRGIAGTVFVHKIVGALAKQGLLECNRLFDPFRQESGRNH